ncbi:META domain-containing protein [Cryptosporangium phraense]|uniref:META domain-containing protein n=1 Tax=Cryptosporangium phraense TaxID=2593070 RepID=A0A545AEE5_9ACTN|nr:META domain-containing protein [Cryptosporangium phraense]TQS39692.1 META domain-containing protein [Cryptosporangium phraense]
MGRFVVGVLVFVLAGCAGAPSEAAPKTSVAPTTAPNPTLVGHRWWVVGTRTGGVRAWVRFHDRSVVASAGCNTLVADVRYEASALRFSNVRIPAPIPCPSDSSAALQSIAKAFDGRTVYTLSWPTLRIDHSLVLTGR